MSGGARRGWKGSFGQGQLFPWKGVGGEGGRTVSGLVKAGGKLVCYLRRWYPWDALVGWG